MPKVYNKKIDKGIPEDAVYIGRPSIWGNPWFMLDESKRNTVCDRFERHVAENAEFRRMIQIQLKGKDLVCYCAPRRCHGDTILRIANEETDA